MKIEIRGMRWHRTLGKKHPQMEIVFAGGPCENDDQNGLGSGHLMGWQIRKPATENAKPFF